VVMQTRSRHGEYRPGRLVPSLLLTVTLGLVGCQASQAERAADPPQQAGHQGQHGNAAPAGVPPTQALQRGRVPTVAPLPRTPAALSLQLQALLGHHSALASDMMRSRLRGDPDFAQAANAALTRNSEAMGLVVGSLFGAKARTEFTHLWAEHVTSLFDYAKASADKNNAAKAEAKKEVDEYEEDLAKYFATASKGRLKTQAAKAATHKHAAHLVDQLDAFGAGNYAKADQIYREAYTHTYALGRILAGALLPPSQVRTLEEPSWRLQSELGRLLGEHIVLGVAAMRAGVANTPNFAAAGQSVDANTTALTGAVGTLFGAAAGKSFMQIWADHVDHLMAYTAALVENDEAAKSAAKEKLAQFEKQLATFLGSATGKRLASPQLAEAFQTHDHMLLMQVDAFAAKQYQRAHDITYSTYQHMFILSGQLSNAIGATLAARLPKGGAQTGGDGTPATGNRH
jgi:hypothetical protein